MIYLDNNATTAIRAEVLGEMERVWSLGPLNASSQHAAGRRARRELDQAARRIGFQLGADVAAPGGPQLIFTSGGTEANHLAFFGLAPRPAPRIVSAIEHPSIWQPARDRQAEGGAVAWLPVDRNGVVILDALDRMLEEQAAGAVVCVMAANNETGVRQPLPDVAQRCRSAGARLHIDATQWIGKLPFDFSRLGASSVAFAAHKFHGPIGIGGLLVAPGVKIEAQLRGGAQQLGLRAGTEAVALAAGMALAIELAVADAADVAHRLASLRDSFEAELKRRIEDLQVHGEAAPRLPGTSCLGFPGIDRQSMLMKLDLAGIACSSGSACASGSSEPSYVLEAMGVGRRWLDGSLRFGMSRFSTESEIDQAIERISKSFLGLQQTGGVDKWS